MIKLAKGASTATPTTPPPTPAPAPPALRLTNDLHGQDFLTLGDLDAPQLHALFHTAAAVKADIATYAGLLAGRSIILLFEKPSLRTRITFEVGPAKMGAHTMYFDHSQERIGQRESIKDYGRNLERWVDCIIARTFSHETLEGLALHSDVPVINALSDLYHPCQALADLFTLYERFGELRGTRLTWIGDGNNVCASLMHGAAKLGINMQIITPPGHEPRPHALQTARNDAALSGGQIRLSNDPSDVAGAQAIYTDVWTSMGAAGDPEQRRQTFNPFQVNDSLMARAPDALFMHCLPAKRGQEVTDAVIDSPNSIVYDQAENRMHTQNALLLHILAPTNNSPTTNARP